MSKPIGLVPLDESTDVERVLPWAILFAQRRGLRLALVTIVDTDGATRHSSQGTAWREAEAYLDAVAAEVARQDDTLDVTSMVIGADSDIGEHISRLAEELPAELIVIGSHGRSGFRRWMLGSVAWEIVQTAQSPALVVRTDNGGQVRREAAIQRVLVPLDGSERAEAVLPHAVLVAETFDADLDLLQAVPWSWMLPTSPPADDAREDELSYRLEHTAGAYLTAIQERLPDGIRVERHALHGDPASVILDHAEQTHADLIAMNTHGRSGILRWTLGSVADRILSSSDIPVLLVQVDPDSSSVQHEDNVQAAPDER